MRSYMNPDDLPILPKSRLIDGCYYVGYCRNANIARWSERDQCFYHWRQKFIHVFVEAIKHREDDDVFDVFDAVFRLARGNEYGIVEIPIPEINEIEVI